MRNAIGEINCYDETPHIGFHYDRKVESPIRPAIEKKRLRIITALSDKFRIGKSFWDKAQMRLDFGMPLEDVSAPFIGKLNFADAPSPKTLHGHIILVRRLFAMSLARILRQRRRTDVFHRTKRTLSPARVADGAAVADQGVS